MTEIDNDLLATLLRRSKRCSHPSPELIPYLVEAAMRAYTWWPLKEQDSTILDQVCERLMHTAVWSYFDEEVHRDAMQFLIEQSTNTLSALSAVSSYAELQMICRATRKPVSPTIIPFVWYASTPTSTPQLIVRTLKSRRKHQTYKFTISKEYDII